MPGTPGTLYERSGTGHAYWYRVYYPAPGVQAEELIGSAADETSVADARDRIAFAQWTVEQVGHLRRLGFQVADKGVARVLVELHNRGAFAAGLAVTGTLAYMAWLNELGAVAVAARTQDIDLARRQRLDLASPLPFLSILQATKLPFTAVPGLPSQSPSTSAKLPGRDGLRVDLLAPGRTLGASVAVPELDWHAESIPHYGWLLDGAVEATVLAGGHGIPVRVPLAERFLWHKLYASAGRPATAREKAEKDVMQAATLAALLVEQGDQRLEASLQGAPTAVASSARRRLPTLRRVLAAHPQTLEAVASALR